MKALLLTLLLSLTCTVSLAEIVQHSDSTMDSDLGFALEEEGPEEKQRDVASNENEAPDSEREVASEQDSDGIQFWEYQGE